MKETETLPRVEKRKTFTNIALLALGIFIAGGLLGAFLVNRNQVPPMQGNEACKQAMAAQSKQLQANLNAQFSVPITDGTPTLEQVKNLQNKCDATFQTYTVKVEAK